MGACLLQDAALCLFAQVRQTPGLRAQLVPQGAPSSSPAAAVYAFGIQRSDVTRDDGTWVGLSLDVQDRHQPGLCVLTAGRRLLVSQLSRPVLLAAVDQPLRGVVFWRTEDYRSFVPPLRADVGRALVGSPQRWAHRFAQYLIDSPDSPLHEGRWLLSRESPLRRWRHAGTSHAEYWSSMLVDGLARFAELRAVHGPTVPDGAATAGPQLVRLLHDLNTAEQPTWAWPLPGGEARWRRIAREVTAGQDWPRI